MYCAELFVPFGSDVKCEKKTEKKRRKKTKHKKSLIRMKLHKRMIHIGCINQSQLNRGTKTLSNTIVISGFKYFAELKKFVI